MTSGGRRRERDAIEIAGDYQARAMESPWAAQRFWHAAKIRTLDRVLPPRPEARVADAGCGSGVIARHLAQEARSVIGFDVNPAAIAFAQSTYASRGLSFVHGPLEAIEPAGPFDRIVCLELLEHLYPEQADATLALFARAAAPGADLFLTTPNVRSAWPLIEWALDRTGLVPQLGESQHLALYSRRSLAAAVTRAGWHVREIGAFNGLAPFVAPVGERLARGVESLEFRARRRGPWNLLYCHADLATAHGNRA
jgi:2-polyprenyl-3-methyl-5-hydroxy-6-metoxy-1,4-benzoquinol methylase